jgi:hypothetical protein
MLYRGVVSAETVASRKSKTIYLQEFRKPIYIDTLNVITTISSYLLGLPVFISMDGFLRDASQKRGELEKNPKIADAVELLMRFLGQQDIPEIHFWLDDTGRATQTILDEIHKNSTTLTKKVKTEILKNVDKALKEASGGVICTSDSVIVDEFKSQVFDLAKHVIINAFSPDFIDLSTINKV